jgi:hypothetical protein
MQLNITPTVDGWKADLFVTGHVLGQFVESIIAGGRHIEDVYPFMRIARSDKNIVEFSIFRKRGYGLPSSLEVKLPNLLVYHNEAVAHSLELPSKLDKEESFSISTEIKYQKNDIGKLASVLLTDRLNLCIRGIMSSKDYFLEHCLVHCERIEGKGYDMILKDAASIIKHAHAKLSDNIEMLTHDFVFVGSRSLMQRIETQYRQLISDSPQSIVYLPIYRSIKGQFRLYGYPLYEYPYSNCEHNEGWLSAMKCLKMHLADFGSIKNVLEVAEDMKHRLLSSSHFKFLGQISENPFMQFNEQAYEKVVFCVDGELYTALRTTAEKPSKDLGGLEGSLVKDKHNCLLLHGIKVNPIYTNTDTGKNFMILTERNNLLFGLGSLYNPDLGNHPFISIRRLDASHYEVDVRGTISYDINNDKLIEATTNLSLA